jgi:hypothetical protein
MIGAFWRLARIERAERTYFMEIRASNISRFIRALQPDDIEELRRRHSGSNSSQRLTTDQRSLDPEEDPPSGSSETGSEPLNANWHPSARKFTRLPNWDTALLEALVPAKEARPKTYVDKQRRATLRELLRALETMTDLLRASSAYRRMSDSDTKADDSDVRLRPPTA